jgi:hypothetical protein
MRCRVDGFPVHAFNERRRRHIVNVMRTPAPSIPRFVQAVAGYWP